MSVTYAPVKWNRNKRIYDALIAAGVLGYLAVFLAVGSLVWTGDRAISFPILLMRAFGTCSFLMLHVVLCIGPLARLDRRFTPLLYNRRHLGVATFFVALAHAGVAIGFYHGFGSANPFISLLTVPGTIPFEWLGLAALAVLFLMAATSHDFWQKTLGPSAWKWLHMLVYPLYGLLVAHVLLGALRTEMSVLYPIILGTGFITIAGLHLAVGLRERQKDESWPTGETPERPPQENTSKESPGRIPLESGWVEVGTLDEIPENRAKVVCLPGRERVAVFRHAGGISAVTNVCAHQRGPLGEGKIVDGCISCPWHGWEYRPEDGCSPPPFEEKIATYRVKLIGRRIFIDPNPLPPGTLTEPARIEEEKHVPG